MTRLITDSSVTRAGFRLSWVTHQCGGRVTTEGEIRSGHLFGFDFE